MVQPITQVPKVSTVWAHKMPYVPVSPLTRRSVPYQRGTGGRVAECQRAPTTPKKRLTLTYLLGGTEERSIGSS
ncbi:hypothetical protein E2C01_059636 [Portunus trituberculatus]|uniref:Uncharacterized protein n=1 Tax=Portunus trituberculatus TaxID=210409 RepID=A0A5B7GYX7_PORTR|nr:hypothetical protein [Portunus trituberculatus]